MMDPSNKCGLRTLADERGGRRACAAWGGLTLVLCPDTLAEICGVHPRGRRRLSSPTYAVRLRPLPLPLLSAINC
jgi:hypothetical protein